MKKLIAEITNILFFIIGIGLTIYNFITINISISTFSYFSKNPNYFDIMMFLIYYIPFILLLTIVIIFWRNITKKSISKNYQYSYIVFLLSFIIYYIFVFNNAKVEYIPKENFHVINHDKQFSSEDNGYNSINDFNPQFRYDIQDMKIYCLTDDKCTQEQKEQTIEISQEYIKNNISTYSEYTDELYNISQKQFIKGDDDPKTYLKVTGMIGPLKFQKIIDKQYLKNNQLDDILKYYESNYKISNMLLQSDNGIISFIVGTTIRSTILDNLNYLIKNNSLTVSQRNQIKDLVNHYKIQESNLMYENAIKSEYLQSFNINERIDNSLIFNTEEFLNLRRYVFQKKFINGEELDISFDRHFFTQTGLYNFMYSDTNYFNYRDDLLDIIQEEMEFIESVIIEDY